MIQVDFVTMDWTREQSTLDKYLQKFARVKLCLETSLNNSVQSDMPKTIQMLQTQTLL